MWKIIPLLLSFLMVYICQDYKHLQSFVQDAVNFKDHMLNLKSLAWYGESCDPLFICYPATV